MRGRGARVVSVYTVPLTLSEFYKLSAFDIVYSRRRLKEVVRDAVMQSVYSGDSATIKAIVKKAHVKEDSLDILYRISSGDIVVDPIRVHDFSLYLEELFNILKSRLASGVKYSREFSEAFSEFLVTEINRIREGRTVVKRKIRSLKRRLNKISQRIAKYRILYLYTESNKLKKLESRKYSLEEKLREYEILYKSLHLFIWDVFRWYLEIKRLSSTIELLEAKYSVGELNREYYVSEREILVKRLEEAKKAYTSSISFTKAKLRSLENSIIDLTKENIINSNANTILLNELTQSEKVVKEIH